MRAETAPCPVNRRRAHATPSTGHPGSGRRATTAPCCHNSRSSETQRAPSQKPAPVQHAEHRYVHYPLRGAVRSMHSRNAEGEAPRPRLAQCSTASLVAGAFLPVAFIGTFPASGACGRAAPRVIDVVLVMADTCLRRRIYSEVCALVQVAPFAYAPCGAAPAAIGQPQLGGRADSCNGRGEPRSREERFQFGLALCIHKA